MSPLLSKTPSKTSLRSEKSVGSAREESDTQRKVLIYPVVYVEDKRISQSNPRGATSVEFATVELLTTCKNHHLSGKAYVFGMARAGDTLDEEKLRSLKKQFFGNVVNLPSSIRVMDWREPLTKYHDENVTFRISDKTSGTTVKREYKGLEDNDDDNIDHREATSIDLYIYGLHDSLQFDTPTAKFNSLPKPGGISAKVVYKFGEKRHNPLKIIAHNDKNSEFRKAIETPDGMPPEKYLSIKLGKGNSQVNVHYMDKNGNQMDVESFMDKFGSTKS